MADDERDGYAPQDNRRRPDKVMVAALNAGTNLIAEIRRSAGPRTATRALPVICAQLGIDVDLSISDTLAQGELDLPEPAPGQK